MDVAGLADRLAGRQARGRAMAEARMGAENGASTVTVRHKTGGPPVQDPVTGLEAPAWASTPGVPFRLGKSTGYQTLTIGGVVQQVAVRPGHLPIGTVLADNDLLEVTAGENAGRVWRVLESAGTDQSTALHVPLVEAQRPTEWGA